MKIIREVRRLEEDLKRVGFISEDNIVKYLDKPTDSAQGIPIMLTLSRGGSSKIAYYRLETDKWFRRYFEPGKGFGLMIRKLKVSGKGVSGPNNKTEYPILVTYLPNEFDHPDEDTKYNYVRAKGLLILDNNKYTDPKGVEKFVNANIKIYKP